MSMQLTMKPYITAGVALVGASVIAVTPIAPHPEAYLSPSVSLTAAVENPIKVFTPVFNAAGDWLTTTIKSELANPLPILHQIAANQITTVEGVLAAIKGAASGIGQLVQGLPEALNAAGALIRAGDYTGAVDSLVLSGLQPILNTIMGFWTPMQAVLERPFVVGKALVPALFDAVLGVTLAVVMSTIGIGMDLGTTPLLQQIIKSTQSVFAAVGTFDAGNVINAIQHGIADVALNVIGGFNEFTRDTLPFIRDSIVNALKAGQPVPNAAIATVASAPEVPAATITLDLPTLELPVGEVPAATAGSATGTPVSVTVESEAPVAAEPVAEEPAVTEPAAEEPAVTEPAVTEPAAEEPAVTDPVSVKPVAAEPTDADEAEPTKSPAKPLVRDSIKAEPGKTGDLTSGSGSGSGKATDTDSDDKASSAAPSETDTDTDTKTETKTETKTDTETDTETKTKTKTEANTGAGSGAADSGSGGADS